MKILDLFSGIGGFSLGLERAGMTTVAFCEIDAKARLVLKKHWPNVPVFEDITTLTKADIHDEIDIIAGGFPCQDISLAGKGAGLAGARSGLWSEFHRLIAEIRPRYAVIENVSALRNRGLDTVLRSLAEIGYDAEWHCIPACAVGAPHRRDRVWIVAYPASKQRDGSNNNARISLGQQSFSESGNGGGARNVAYPASQWRGRGRIGTKPTGRDEFADRRADKADERLSNGADNEANAQRPDTDSLRPYRTEINQYGGVEFRNQQDCEPGSVGKTLADCIRARLEGHTGDGEVVGDEGPDGSTAEAGLCGGEHPGWWWAVEPDVGRVANGVPNRVDRLKQLGNAVVPQIPELIGRAIMDYENALG